MNDPVMVSQLLCCVMSALTGLVAAVSPVDLRTCTVFESVTKGLVLFN